MESLSAAAVAELVGGTCVGSGDAIIDGIAALDVAQPNDASFLGNEKYRADVITSQAAIVLVPQDYDVEPPVGRAWVKCEDASAAFTVLAEQFAPPPVVHEPGWHETAVVAPSATIAASAHLGPHVVVEADVEIGENVVICAGSFVGQGSRLGADCLIHANVTIRERSMIGERVIIHSATVIGSDGFGYISDAKGHHKIPQYGNVQIDDDVEIGAGVTIDRARFAKTWVKRGAKIDNLVQIGHNAVIGEYAILVSQVGISGSTKVGRFAALGGQVGVAGHVNIGDGAQAMGQAGIIGDIEAGVTVGGMPAIPRQRFLRQSAYIQRLPDMAKELKALRKELAELKKAQNEAEE